MAATPPHDFPFDPTGGYTPAQLLALKPVIEEPADFAAFWRETFAEAMAAPLDWTIRPSTTRRLEGHDVFDIEFAGLLGNRIGGWLTKPRNHPVRRGFLIGHGYGGRDEIHAFIPAPDAATIQPVCSGLPSLSFHPSLPSQGGQHVLHGIESRETYLHRHSVMDLWRAASVLHEAVPESKPRLDYMGSSFGGGIGALALPWDARLHRAYLEVPSFGNHPLRLELPCNGSGEAVRLLAQKRPEIRNVLAYFDAALAARHTRIPVFVAAAAFDPAVPPAGQYSVFNDLAGPKELYPLTAGHYDGYPGQSREELEIHARLTQFFA